MEDVYKKDNNINMLINKQSVPVNISGPCTFGEKVVHAYVYADTADGIMSTHRQAS